MLDHSEPAEHSEYLALLDRCLLDRAISRHESDDLVALAEDRGIGRSQCEALNRTYFGALVQVAWEDAVLTMEEREDIVIVAALLQIEPAVLEAAVQGPPSSAKRMEVSMRPVLQPGDLVVLTGEMTRFREEWEADLVPHGFVPWRAVTKKVTLVVAAEPDSEPGKARKARDHGIPIVNEPALAKLVEDRAVVAS